MLFDKVPLKSRLKNQFTYAVIRKIQGEWLKASNIRTEQFPYYFTEQDNCHISVSLHREEKKSDRQAKRKKNTACYSINEKNYYCDFSLPQKSSNFQFNTNYQHSNKASAGLIKKLIHLQIFIITYNFSASLAISLTCKLCAVIELWYNTKQILSLTPKIKTAFYFGN